MLKVIDKIRNIAILQFFTVYLRFLIGASFIFAAIGMGKLNNSNSSFGSESFPIDESTPGMILFFKVMFESGLYWKFIGWTQIIAGVLLMTQRFAKVGALIFFGLILNIFIITVSYNFKGTPIITGLLLLSIIFLLIWDAKSFLFLFLKEGILENQNLKIENSNFWIWLGILMVVTVFLLAILKIKIFIIFFIFLIEGLLGLIFFLLNKKHFF